MTIVHRGHVGSDQTSARSSHDSVKSLTRDNNN